MPKVLRTALNLLIVSDNRRSDPMICKNFQKQTVGDSAVQDMYPDDAAFTRRRTDD